MAHSAAAESVADVFDRYGIALGRANIDRSAGAKAVRRLLAGTGTVTLKVVDTDGNRRAVDELSRLVPDPLNLNVPAKRDADERGLHGDDGADTFRYGVASPSWETMEPLVLRHGINVTDGKDDEDPFTPMLERHGALEVEYEQRPAGADGQFGNW